MPKDIKVLVCGAAGKMGQCVVRAVDAEAGFKLVSAVDRTGNPNSTKEILETLSKDPDPSVRSKVVENPNVTRETFEILLHDTSEFVRAAVVRRLLAEY